MIIAALLVASAHAIALRGANSTDANSTEYAARVCGQMGLASSKGFIAFVNSQVATKVDGAGPGMSPDDYTFDEVYKSGYLYADCQRDMMYEFGDKFGQYANKYDMETSGNTSIVGYAE